MSKCARHPPEIRGHAARSFYLHFRPTSDLLLLILSIYALLFTEKTAASIDKGFGGSADKYAAYLETPEGRLRLDLAFANLQELLPQPIGSLLALHLGSGPGAIGVRLARLGISVTLMDVSLPMLDLAKHAAQEAGVTERIALKHGDAAQLADLFEAGSFALILCHNVLEFVDDPSAVLCSAACLLRDPFGVLSVLVRNQPDEDLKAALLGGDLTALSGETSLCREVRCGCLRQTACVRV